MNITFPLVTFMAMAAIVMALVVYRAIVARKEDDYLHVHDAEASLVPQQAAVAARLSAIDKWGQILTIVTLCYGVLLGAMYLWQGWQESLKLPS